MTTAMIGVCSDFEATTHLMHRDRQEINSLSCFRSLLWRYDLPECKPAQFISFRDAQNCGTLVLRTSLQCWVHSSRLGCPGKSSRADFILFFLLSSLHHLLEQICSGPSWTVLDHDPQVALWPSYTLSCAHCCVKSNIFT